MQDVLNVIELIGDDNLSVHSFIIPERSVRNDEKYKKKVEAAEKLFGQKGIENGMLQGEVASWIEEGFYQNGDYKLYLCWTE